MRLRYGRELGLVARGGCTGDGLPVAGAEVMVMVKIKKGYHPASIDRVPRATWIASVDPRNNPMR